MTVLFTILFIFFFESNCYNNGVAKLPPMGYNPWSTFWCQIDCKKYKDNCISEGLFLEQIDKMVSLGLRDKGYKYFNFDDCWQDTERDPKTGKLRPDPARFPDGVRYIADYLKDRGMALGMYSDVGTKSCGGYPGGLNHESLDVDTFLNDWNVTYLKLDGCYLDVSDMKEKYTLWSQLLNKTGIHVVFSCSWPAYEKVHYSVIDYIGKICNLWRFYDDVRPEYTSIYNIITYVGDNQDHYVPYSEPYWHNDPDMLVIGHTTMSISEQRTQMALWSMMAAPLLISADLRSISNDSLQIYLNEEVIAVDQDPLVKQGKRMWKKGTTEIWLKQLSGQEGVYALAMLNSGKKKTDIEAQWSELGIPGNVYKVRDLWLRKDLGSKNGSFVSDVESHDTQIYVIKKT